MESANVLNEKFGVQNFAFLVRDKRILLLLGERQEGDQERLGVRGLCGLQQRLPGEGGGLLKRLLCPFTSAVLLGFTVNL